MSNERNTKAQVFIAALVFIVIIGSAFCNARGMRSLHNENESAYTPLVGLRVGINNAPTSNAIHHQHFISARHLYSTPTFNSDLGTKNVVDNIIPESSSNKVVMINFDDGHKSQLIYAKPILDKYGFKASFFLICGRVGTQPSWMNWQDIAELKKDGMDIESHTMTHANLNKLSANALNYEIGGSKQCFAKHGYNTTIFGYPFNLGSDKPSVVNLVAKYYNIGRSGTDRLMFLNCIGFMKDTQTDCRTYSVNGKLTHANRHDVRSASFYHISNKHNFSHKYQNIPQYSRAANGIVTYVKDDSTIGGPNPIYQKYTNFITIMHAKLITQQPWLHYNKYHLTTE